MVGFGHCQSRNEEWRSCALSINPARQKKDLVLLAFIFPHAPYRSIVLAFALWRAPIRRFASVFLIMKALCSAVVESLSLHQITEYEFIIVVIINCLFVSRFHQTSLVPFLPL